MEIYREFGVENTGETDRSLTGCLPNVPSSQRVADELRERLLTSGADVVDVSDLPDQNWEEVWRRFFKPRRVGNRFVVKPTWEEFAAEPEDIVLVLDPGQAFGTGDHPTTRMCLELLEELDLLGQRVLDIGCGSGILAVAACKLGAEVSACDIDPIAVEVTRLNAARNRVEFETWIEGQMGSDIRNLPQDEVPLDPGEAEGLTTPEGSNNLARGRRPLDRGDHPDRPRRGRIDHAAMGAPSAIPDYNLVLSNIISATLIRMSHQVSGLVEPGGGWIVSGIIDQNWPEVRAAAERADFRLVTERHEDGWVAARFHRIEVGE